MHLYFKKKKGSDCMKSTRIHTSFESVLGIYDVCIYPCGSTALSTKSEIIYNDIIQVSPGENILEYLKNALDASNKKGCKSIMIFLPLLAPDYYFGRLLVEVEKDIESLIGSYPKFENLCFFVPNQFYYRLMFSDHF